MNLEQIQPIVKAGLEARVSKEAAESPLARRIAEQLVSLYPQITHAVKNGRKAVETIVGMSLGSMAEFYETWHVAGVKLESRSEEPVEVVKAGLVAEQVGVMRAYVRQQIEDNMPRMFDRLRADTQIVINNPAAYGLKPKKPKGGESDATSPRATTNPFRKGVDKLVEKGRKPKGIDKRARRVADEGDEAKEEKRPD